MIALNPTGESPASNVLGATTFAQNLTAPQNLSGLFQNGNIDLTWSGRPADALAVVEVMPFGSSEWLYVDTVSADNFSFFPGETNAYDFHVKFIQSSAESAYTQTTDSLIVPKILRIYVPMVSH
jgi:hypothetical protein